MCFFAVTDDLKKLVLKLEERVGQLEKHGGGGGGSAPAKKEEEDDDEVDLFGSDSDEEEDAEKVRKCEVAEVKTWLHQLVTFCFQARIREERLKAYAEKKSKKAAVIAKTSVLLDVKPWDDETDMNEMLKCCKTIEKDGLVWGACEYKHG